MMLGSSPVADILGMVAGHTYYYLEDVYPHTINGRRLLKTPGWVKALFPTQETIQMAPMRFHVVGAANRQQPVRQELQPEQAFHREDHPHID